RPRDQLELGPVSSRERLRGSTLSEARCGSADSGCIRELCDRNTGSRRSGFTYRRLGSGNADLSHEDFRASRGSHDLSRGRITPYVEGQLRRSVRRFDLLLGSRSRFSRSRRSRAAALWDTFIKPAEDSWPSSITLGQSPKFS